MGLRDKVLARVAHELLNTGRDESQIIDGIVKDTFYTRQEACLLYVEVLQKIVDSIRKIGGESRGKRTKRRKKNR